MTLEASKTDGCLAQGCRANSNVEAKMYQCHQQKAVLKAIITRLFIMPLLHSFVREPSGVLLLFYFSTLKIYLFKSHNHVLTNVFLTAPFCLHFKAY